MILEILLVSTKKNSVCFELNFVAKNYLHFVILYKKNHCTPSRNMNHPFQGENLDF